MNGIILQLLAVIELGIPIHQEKKKRSKKFKRWKNEKKVRKVRREWQRELQTPAVDLTNTRTHVAGTYV
jgi:hypothetical protein